MTVVERISFDSLHMGAAGRRGGASRSGTLEADAVVDTTSKGPTWFISYNTKRPGPSPVRTRVAALLSELADDAENRRLLFEDLASADSTDAISRTVFEWEETLRFEREESEAAQRVLTRIEALRR